VCKEILISFFDLLDIASNRCIHSFIMLAIASFNLNEPSAHFTMNHPISSHMNPTLVFHSKADKAIFVGALSRKSALAFACARMHSLGEKGTLANISRFPTITQRKEGSA
jgi:hypothetical protein